jgi:carbon monoxide dehydrogenase subunit G
MNLEGKVTIKAAREKIWEFLNDPHAVSQCAPGVEGLEVLEPGKKFRATATVGFGSVKAKFKTDVEWVEMEPPGRATMKAHGTAPGSAVDVISEMELLEVGQGETDLKWRAEVYVLGTIASLASRLMGSVSKKLTRQFFDCLKAKIEA